MTAEPTTTRLGASKTILTRLLGLNPAPLSRTSWPSRALVGADTTGAATKAGGMARVVGGGGGTTVVVVLDDAVGLSAGATVGLVEVVIAGEGRVVVVERADVVVRLVVVVVGPAPARGEVG
jgi:hypothetical protein